MGIISRLAEACQKCPFVESCDHKRMEAMAYIEPAAIGIDMAAPGIESMSGSIMSQLDGDIAINLSTDSINEQYQRHAIQEALGALRLSLCHFERGKEQ